MAASHPTASATALQEILPFGHAHVWSWSLDMPLTRLERMQCFLSAEERDRADRFVFPEIRDHFIAGRGYLRVILGRYLNRSPESLRFTTGKAGKPRLVQAANSDPITFNLAHAGGVAFLAVAYGIDIGVDIEPLVLPEEAESLVEQFFSPNEAGEFRFLPDECRAEAFINLWTRKEALLKATGEGIAHHLREVEVTFRPGEPARVVSVPEEWGHEWSMESFTPFPGFRAAVAAACPVMVVHSLSCPNHHLPS